MAGESIRTTVTSKLKEQVPLLLLGLPSLQFVIPELQEKFCARFGIPYSQALRSFSVTFFVLPCFLLLYWRYDAVIRNPSRKESRNIPLLLILTVTFVAVAIVLPRIVVLLSSTWSVYSVVGIFIFLIAGYISRKMYDKPLMLCLSSRKEVVKYRGLRGFQLNTIMWLICAFTIIAACQFSLPWFTFNSISRKEDAVLSIASLLLLLTPLFYYAVCLKKREERHYWGSGTSACYTVILAALLIWLLPWVTEYGLNQGDERGEDVSLKAPLTIQDYQRVIDTLADQDIQTLMKSVDTATVGYEAALLTANWARHTVRMEEIRERFDTLSRARIPSVVSAYLEDEAIRKFLSKLKKEDSAYLDSPLKDSEASVSLLINGYFQPELVKRKYLLQAGISSAKSRIIPIIKQVESRGFMYFFIVILLCLCYRYLLDAEVNPREFVSDRERSPYALQNSDASDEQVIHLSTNGGVENEDKRRDELDRTPTSPTSATSSPGGMTNIQGLTGNVQSPNRRKESITRDIARAVKADERRKLWQRAPKDRMTLDFFLALFILLSIPLIRPLDVEKLDVQSSYWMFRLPMWYMPSYIANIGKGVVDNHPAQSMTIFQDAKPTDRDDLTITDAKESKDTSDFRPLIIDTTSGAVRKNLKIIANHLGRIHDEVTASKTELRENGRKSDGWRRAFSDSWGTHLLTRSNSSQNRQGADTGNENKFQSVINEFLGTKNRTQH